MGELHRAALLQKANSLVKSNHLLQAQTICQELVAQNKSDINALELLAKIAMELGKNDECVVLLKKCVAIKPREPHFLVTLGGRYMSLARYDEAIATFQKVLKFAPANIDAVTGLADTYEKKGDRDADRARLEPFIESQTDDVYMAKIQCVIDTADGNPARGIEILERHGKRQPIPVNAIFTLAKAYEKLGNADRAFELYSISNNALGVPFDLDAYIKGIDELIALFTKDFVRKLPRARTESSTAIFVTGRPRSGTTLVARIIGSHPDAFDAGELADIHHIVENLNLEIGSTLLYPKVVRDLDQADADRVSEIYLNSIKALSGNARYVVDKSLATFRHLGLIQSILPKSHVVYVRRDYIDNALACFTENLNSNFAYTADLKNLGATAVHYERLMKHWADVLELPILFLDYEELVANQEQVTRRLIDFLGLPWDDQCLRFHESAADRRASKAALTLSYDQVRKPIYKTSVGRAKKFEKHLAPLLEELAKGGLIPKDKPTGQ